MRIYKTSLLGICLGVDYITSHCDEKESSRNRDAYGVITKFKQALPHVDNNNLLVGKVSLKDGTIVYKTKVKSLSRDYPNFKVAQTEIRAPIDEIVSLYLNHELRKDWDKTNFKSSSVIASEISQSEENMNYLLGRPGYVYPSRDFVFVYRKLPGGVVGLHDYRTVAILSMDSAESIPNSMWAVRGNMNSLLVLEPISAERTRATYIIEINYRGWLPAFLVDLNGNQLISTLQLLKKELEGAEAGDDSTLSIEEAARRRFQKRIEYEKRKEDSGAAGATLIDNEFLGSRDDLVNTISILEKRLANILSTERTEKLDLSDLRRRVESDLRNARERLNKLK